MTRILAIVFVVCATAHVAAAQSFPTPRVRPARPVPPTPPVAPAAPAAPTPPSPPAFPYVDALPDFDPDFFASINDALAGIDFDGIQAATKDALAGLDFSFAQQKPFPNPPLPPLPPQDVRGTQEESTYEQARSLIERDQYERALQAFDRVIERRGTRTDAAMYWKAYSLSKLSRAPEALSVLGDLQKQFASSAWAKDARALEVEVRQQSGQAVPANSTDDEVKLLALRGVMQSDPDAGVPIIEKMLAGDASVRVKDRALFVLSQSRSPRARDVIAGVAKGASNPDLRLRAVRYLGMRSDTESRQALDEIYRSTSDAELKRSIIRSFMMSNGTNATERLVQIARTEKDPELQQTAIRTLGVIAQSDAAEALRAIYTSDVPVETKKAVIGALGMRPNGAATLVTLARAERNPELKTEIVRRLSTMRSPEARDYMLELLK
jgi:tetratricopeptide (TPR) repeat protein